MPALQLTRPDSTLCDEASDACLVQYELGRRTRQLGVANQRKLKLFEIRVRFSFHHCEPTGRANARPMTGSAKQSIFVAQPEAWIASSLTLLAMTEAPHQ